MPWVSPAVTSEPAYVELDWCHSAAPEPAVSSEASAPPSHLHVDAACLPEFFLPESLAHVSNQSNDFLTALDSEDNLSGGGGSPINAFEWGEPQTPPATHLAGTWQCRWHDSAKSVGTVSQNGHVFTKTAGAQKIRKSSSGVTQALSSICMVFDKSLRKGGTHMYNYQILQGEVGAADGAGFVFDSRVRRNNIQRMRAVFLNQRGQICLRDHARVKKIGAELPPLDIGMSLKFSIDLDNLYCQFTVSAADGGIIGAADVGLSYCSEGIFDGDASMLRSGFFCAVVTKDISVSLA